MNESDEGSWLEVDQVVDCAQDSQREDGVDYCGHDGES